MNMTMVGGSLDSLGILFSMMAFLLFTMLLLLLTVFPTNEKTVISVRAPVSTAIPNFMHGLMCFKVLCSLPFV